MGCSFPNSPPLAIRNSSAYPTRPAAPEIATCIGRLVSKVLVLRAINPELRPGGDDPAKSRPLPESMVRDFFGAVVVTVVVPLDRRSRIGMPVIAIRMGGKSSFTLLFRLRCVVDEQRVKHG